MAVTDSNFSRRAVLKATGGTAAGLTFAGTANAAEGHDEYDKGCRYDTVAMHMGDHSTGLPGSGDHNDPVQRVLCPDHPHAKTGPGHTMKHFNARVEGCPDGTGLSNCEDGEEWPDCTTWPEPTKAIIRESREALTTAYDDVGTLIAEGYIPYFDVVLPGAADGVSHWLNPDYINNTDAKPDPWKPESVMFENKYWSPIGPMFIGSDEGALVHDVQSLWGYDRDGDVEWHVGYEDSVSDPSYAGGNRSVRACGPCYPMHGHDGMPGRFAWWYYRQVHEADYASGNPEDLTLPCYTAPMMHAWIFPTQAGPHSATSGAPSSSYEPGRTPNRPGYPTPATPGEDRLSMDVLPRDIQERAMPDRLAKELEVIEGLSTERLQTATIAELEDLMDRRFGPADPGDTDVQRNMDQLRDLLG